MAIKNKGAAFYYRTSGREQIFNFIHAIMLPDRKIDSYKERDTVWESF